MSHPSPTTRECYQELSHVSTYSINKLELYNDETLQVILEPLAKWCKADYIEKSVTSINAKENKVILADGQVVEYDVLALNLGSRTKGTTGDHPVGGVWEYSLTTRPINHLLPKIIEKEKQLKERGITPDVVVIGGGAAGVELSFAFKARWSKYFGEEIKV